MNGNGARWWRAGLFIAAMVVLGTCSSYQRALEPQPADESVINASPTNYKPELLGAMHAYLNDPSAIRDAGISEPMLKQIGNRTRYIVCLRFNGKQKANTYAGMKEIAAVFVPGRFDHFVETTRDACAGVTYAPFPELEKLAR